MIADSLLHITQLFRRQDGSRQRGVSSCAVPGHHHLMFEAAGLGPGSSATRSLGFFDGCRRKRNVIDYDRTLVVTRTEAEEIVAEAQAFIEIVEKWIAAHHPKLLP
jgi:hypothetical protein